MAARPPCLVADSWLRRDELLVLLHVSRAWSDSSASDQRDVPSQCSSGWQHGFIPHFQSRSSETRLGFQLAKAVSSLQQLGQFDSSPSTDQVLLQDTTRLLRGVRLQDSSCDAFSGCRHWGYTSEWSHRHQGWTKSQSPHGLPPCCSIQERQFVCSPPI